MKLTDILKDIKTRENSSSCFIEIHPDGSGAVYISYQRHEELLFGFDSNIEELSKSILTAYRNHYKIDNETLTL